jgi:hypothetical protein
VAEAVENVQKPNIIVIISHYSNYYSINIAINEDYLTNYCSNIDGSNFFNSLGYFSPCWGASIDDRNAPES